jgi:hypothetical protein
MQIWFSFANWQSMYHPWFELSNGVSPLLAITVRKRDLDGAWHPFLRQRFDNLIDLSDYGVLEQGAAHGELSPPYKDVDHSHLVGSAIIRKPGGFMKPHSLVPAKFVPCSRGWSFPSGTFNRLISTKESVEFRTGILPFDYPNAGVVPAVPYGYDFEHDRAPDENSRYVNFSKASFGSHWENGIQYLDAVMIEDVCLRGRISDGVAGYAGIEGIYDSYRSNMSLHITHFRALWNDELSRLEYLYLRFEGYGSYDNKDYWKNSWNPDIYHSPVSSFSFERRCAVYDSWEDENYNPFFREVGYSIAAWNRRTSDWLHMGDLVTPHMAENVRAEALVADPEQYSEVNLIENLAGLSFGAYSEALATLLRGYDSFLLGDVTAATEALKSTYLWYCYVFSNDKRDIAALHKSQPWKHISLRQLRPVIQRASDTRPATIAGYEGTLRTTVAYYSRVRENPFAELYDGLDRIGLDPTLENVWNTIPYSFVVDWFTSLDSVLRRIDFALKRHLQLELLGRGESYRFVADNIDVTLIHRALYPCGPVQLNLYRRFWDKEVGEYEFSPTSPSIGYPQLLQGACLLRF